MLIFGHTGLGKGVLDFTRWGQVSGQFLGLFLVGTVFPDFFDKTLYYLLSFLSGRTGIDVGLVSGTRTIAHSAVFVFGGLAAGRVFMKPALLFFFYGAATHILLDHCGDFVGWLVSDSARSFFETPFYADSRIIGIFWPFLGTEFPETPFASARQHIIDVFLRPHIILSEFLGFCLLIRDRRRVATAVHQLFVN